MVSKFLEFYAHDLFKGAMFEYHCYTTSLNHPTLLKQP